ncbi:MAG TPA: RagB/SusD family nutrient uptake outer membrane protein [Hanamia sp.]|jgi:starch-binding outer membrane protein, SusD/RagB family|nr:RagB/SusD family nutrient uptake outer membrane protein [Hanamia sp.]
MKKILYSLSIVLSASVLLLESCSKEFITKNPYDKVPSDKAITDASSMQTALNGAYAELRTVALYGRDFPITGDLMADNTFVEQNNSGRYLPQFNYTVTNSDGVFGEIWDNAYSGILYSNLIIDAKVTGQGIDQIRSQAYALRALLYFKLINIYARPYTDNPQALGVPLILHYDPTLLPSRTSVDSVYTQIVSDLKTAFQTAPDYENSVRLSKYSIEGLLARAYFYMGDYVNAKAAALDVINNSGFTLVNTATAYKAFWSNPGIQTNQSEVMFEVDVDAVNNNSSDDLGAMVDGGYTDIYASQQLVGLYSSTDIRKSVLIPGATKSGAAATLIGKYPNYNNTADKDNIKVIRLAEMYLIAAEASLPNNESDAKKYLNELMSYRDPSFAGYSSTGAQLLKDIVTERRKELAFEGDRFYDLNRLKWDISRGTKNPGSIDQGLETIPYSDYRRIAPIPLGEIQANANIASQQNPKY